MKRIIIISLTMILMTIYGIRLYSVNSKKDYPITLSFDRDEEVYIENDFFNSCSEDMDGYSVKIKDTELFTVDEFKDKYGVTDEELFSLYDHIFIVKATFGNHGNKSGEQGGIDLGEYIIQNSSFMNIVERDAYSILNGGNPLRFSLKNNSYYDIMIPFGINERFIDIDSLCKGKTKLIISLYPHKKEITL